MKRIAQILLAALVAVAAHTARAVNYSPSDLLLVFHKANFNDVIIDIGSVNNFTGLSAGTVVPVSYDTGLVSSNFGGSLAGVSFAVVGENDGQAHLWLTDADAGTAAGDVTPGTYAPLQSKINAVGVNASLITGGSADPFVIDSSDVNSYSFIVSPGDAGGIASLGGNSSFTVSAAYPATAAFYRLVPDTLNPMPSAVKLGNFTLAVGGSLSFTAGAAVPAVTGISGSSTVTRGGSATFNATAEGATSYQWYLNGVAISGATNSSLTVNNVQPDDIGNYTVVAVNSTYATSSTSSPAAILKTTPAYAATDLLLVFHDGVHSDVEIDLGSISNFQSQASGSAQSVSYNKALVLANFGGSLAGVTASFVAESDSPVARVWLSDADLELVGPSLTPNTYATLQSKVNSAGSVAAGLVPNLDYNNPLVISPSDANSYSTIVSPGDATTVNSMGGDAPYTIGESFPGFSTLYELHPNAAGSVVGVFALAANGDINFSEVPSGNTLGGPSILTQPAPTSLTTNYGSSKTYTVVATNSFPGGNGVTLGYQWKLNGTNIPGATASSYTASSIQDDDAGAYTVLVTSAFGSVTSSTATLALVADSKLPTVVIQHPANKGLSADALVSGTASDTKIGKLVLINKVFYGVDGGPVTNVATGTTNWSFSLATALPGNHTVVVQAQDFALNLSPAKTNTFFYEVFSTLTIHTNGNGSVKNSGSTVLGSVADGASLVVGKTYKIQATAAGNYLFSNIVDSAVGPTTVSLYSFTMQSNLSLTVNFVANRFFAAAGTYYGLITGTTTNGVTFDDSGFMKVVVTGKSNKLGTFSGTVYMSGNSKAISGSIGLDGHGTSKPIDRSKWSKDNITVGIVLPFDSSDTISGTVTDAGPITNFVSTFSGDRLFATNTYDGRYTLVIPGDAAHSSTMPGGSGIGFVYVTNNLATAAGSKLADFQGFAPIKSAVTKNGIWHVYSVADTDTAVGGQKDSVIMGDITLSNISGTLTWIKKASAGSTALYGVNGFALEADVYGSTYPTNATALYGTEIVLPLTVVTAGTAGNGNIALAGSQLVSSISQTNLLQLVNGKNKFFPGAFKPASNPNSISALAFVPATGKVTGSFKPLGAPYGTASIFGGAVISSNYFRGFFTPATVVKESGSFELNP